MELKKLHLGTMSYAVDSMDEVAHQLATALGVPSAAGSSFCQLASTPADAFADGSKLGAHGRTASMPTGVTLATRGRRDMSSRVKDVVLALGLCHNVRLASPALRPELTPLRHRSLPPSTTTGPSPTKPPRPTKSPSSAGPNPSASPSPPATAPPCPSARPPAKPSPSTSSKSSPSPLNPSGWES